MDNTESERWDHGMRMKCGNPTNMRWPQAVARACAQLCHQCSYRFLGGVIPNAPLSREDLGKDIVDYNMMEEQQW